MIRQAQTYLTGAVSGTALIAAAVVAFVVLVSFQALRDWPLAGIGGGGDSPAVSKGQPVSPGGAAGAAGAASATLAKDGGAAGDRAGAGVAGDRASSGVTVGASPSPQEAPSPTGSPLTQTPGASPGGGDGAGSSPSTSSDAARGGGGGGDGGGGGLLPDTGGASGGSGSTSGAVTDTVNDTVSGVDEAAAGTLGETGVTKVTEEVVTGVAGPESPVGQTVDKAAETVGGLLGGNR